MKGHAGAISSILFCASGCGLVSASTDGTVRYWSDGTSEVLLNVPYQISAMAHHSRSESLAVGSADGLVRFWQFSNLRADLISRATFEAGSVVRSLAFSHDFDTLAVGLDHGILLRQTNELKLLERQSGPIWSMVFSTNDADLVGAVGDGSAQVWNLASGRLRSLLLGHQSSLRTVNYSPDGSLIATGAEDHTIRLWASPLAGRAKNL